MLKKKIKLITSTIGLVLNIKLYKAIGTNKKLPKVIQFPITSKCNSRCVMCNIWKHTHESEISPDELNNYFKDTIFNQVIAVGINGGEPSLIKNLPEMVEQVLHLPSLKSLNIISNGFNKKQLLSKIKPIYSLCKSKKISFHLSFSLDGYKNIHNSVRGISKAFNGTTNTIDCVLNNQNVYCDSVDVGCTIVKQNVDNLIELDTYAVMKNYPMKYRLGIENKRIKSNESVFNYSVLYDKKKRQSAAEFIHSRYYKSESINDKFKYFSIFSFLSDKKQNRLMGCDWREDGITIDATGNIYYCAVESKKIGSLREDSAESIFFNNKNIAYRKSIIKTKCDQCIHDYSGKVSISNIVFFLKQYVFEMMWTKIYRIKLLWL